MSNLQVAQTAARPVQVGPGQALYVQTEQTRDTYERVWKYLEENPDAVKLSVRKLGEAAGASKSAASYVLKDFIAKYGA